jgi:hypothetical protein
MVQQQRRLSACLPAVRIGSGQITLTATDRSSSILIAKHDVQLQDLLDVLGEKLVKTHEAQLRRYKAELIEALDAAEAAAGLSPISASASPTRADAPDPPNPDVLHRYTPAFPALGIPVRCCRLRQS